ncbi:hypothetical protein Trydic_g3943 [Trypoxylus dichotomus]
MEAPRDVMPAPRDVMQLRRVALLTAKEYESKVSSSLRRNCKLPVRRIIIRHEPAPLHSVERVYKSKLTQVCNPPRPAAESYQQPLALFLFLQSRSSLST